jgi:hypothetical protein
VRAAATAALVAGAALGIGVGRSLPASEVSPATASVSVSNLSEEDDSLAGSYWSVVEDATGSDTEEAMP